MHYTCDLDHISLNVSCRNRQDFYNRLQQDLTTLAGEDVWREFDATLNVNEQEHLYSAGHGILIPNARLNSLDYTRHLFYRFSRPFQDIATMDDHNVDIVFVLFSPESDGPLHLRRLSRLTRLLQDQVFVRNLREIEKPDSVRGQFMYPDFDTRAA